MKLLDIQAAIGTAILLLSLPCDAKHGHSHQLTHLDGKRSNHRHLHKTIQASPREEGIQDGLEKRGQCAFPNADGMVAIPGAQNAGWAMSPDQSCTPGTYCPYACKPTYVGCQWDPSATAYVYPMNMHGGLYCDDNGNIQKPFPNKPYCEPGTGAVGAQNTLSQNVAFCQTVLPGNEAMLIPTNVEAGSWSGLAVPGPDYWIGSSAHFYVNTPGFSTEEACIWGDKSKPIGNWAPYVVGGQTSANGETFYKVGWNPIYCNDFPGVLPNFGVKVECSGSGCNGVPCSIDPSVVGYGGVTSADSASGAGGANFCVVTIPAGGTANIVIFAAGNSDAGSGSPGVSSKYSATPAPSTYAPAPSTTPPPTTSSSAAPTTSKASHYISLLPSSSVNTTSPTPTPNLGAILFQNDSETSSSSGAAMPSGTGYSTANLTAPSPIPSTTRKSGAPEKFASGSFLGFVILFAAAGYLL